MACLAPDATARMPSAQEREELLCYDVMPEVQMVFDEIAKTSVSLLCDVGGVAVLFAELRALPHDAWLSPARGCPQRVAA